MNKKGMSVVLDLGANIECSSKIYWLFNYELLYIPHFIDKPNVALLNIGSEELEMRLSKKLSNIKWKKIR